MEDWGLIPYATALEKQKGLQSVLVAYKQSLRDGILWEKEIPKQHVIFCEHPPVYTLGNRAKLEHILWTEQELKENEVELFPIRRGGDVTFHGPGQLVGYPIIDLENFFTDIHKYLRFLEEAVILCLKEFGLESGRIEGLSGVWIDPENPLKARKICAIGVHCSRWVTMHGFAFNIHPNLDYFSHIIPCGIEDKGVTSLYQETGKEVPMTRVKQILKEKLQSQFGWNWEL